MKKFTYIDLFAGCGGLSLGLKQAGLQGIWANEIDLDASNTYRRNIGDYIYCGDIRDVDPTDVPHPNILVGGFPCQPFSLSGLQNGYKGKDGDLFFHCVRFLKSLNPEAFILENVTGFIRLKKGLFFKEAINVLSDLGYHVQWKIMNASDYGVPQSRERLFIVGNRLNKEFIFPKPSQSKISVKDAIEDIRQNMDSFQNNEPMKHTERIKKRFASVLPGETARDAMDRDPSLGTAKLTKQCYRRLIADKPAPTIVANFVTTTIHYCEDRNLTAREAARLQSFPDDFIFTGLKTRMSWQKGLSQFEQIGNAVPPKIAFELGKSIINLLLGETPTPAHVKKKSNTNSFQSELFENIKSQNVIENKTVSVKQRGRTSKYKLIYEKIEAAEVGDKIIINENIEDGFKMFCEAAMRRRRINITINKVGNEFHVLKLKRNEN